MKTIRRPRHLDRNRSGRPALGFDRLEPRLALSAGSPAQGRSGPLSVAEVDPAPGATLAAAPAGLTVTFDRAIVQRTISADFRLDRVAADGSTATVAEIGGLVESRGDTPSEVVVTPSDPLGPGRYRLYLLGGSGLIGADGSTVGGADQMVDDFTVAAPSTGPATAVDLGSPVAVMVSAVGSLDPVGRPGAVDYYRVELPQGHFWRLGVEVDAGRIGSPLLPALSVTDDQGHAIATTVASRPDFPGDPYAYLGLGPGIYDIGVSGRGDLPAGTARAGSFRVQVVADPADAPTKVLSFGLDRADPTQASPTGFTLQFAGPLNGPAMVGHTWDLVRVVDDSGRVWSDFATNYDQSQSALKVVFDQPLPAGHYRVELVGQGDLVDLAGKAPVAPGFPAGTLAEFTMPTASTPHDPNDFGPVYWGQLDGSLSAILHVKPGEDVTYRIVITAPCSYNLVTTSTGSAPSITAHVGDKSISLGAGILGLPQSHVFLLQPGVITLDVKGGPHGSTIDWSFLLASGRFDLLLDNGVGQASPLGLRLIAPAPLDLQAGPGIVDGPAAVPSAAAGPSSVANAATPGPAAVAGNPTGTYIAAGAGLVGYPSSQDNSVAVVGPVAPGGMTALSSSSAGIPQGLSVGYTSRSAAPRGGDAGAIAGLVNAPGSDAAAVASTDPAASQPDGDLPPLPDAPGHQEVVQGSGVADRVSTFLAGWLPSRRRAPARARVAPASLDDAALAGLGRDHRADLPESGQDVETADLSSPFGVAVVAVAAVHYHKRLGHWLGRFRTRMVARRRGTTPSGPRRPTV